MVMSPLPPGDFFFYNFLTFANSSNEHARARSPAASRCGPHYWNKNDVIQRWDHFWFFFSADSNFWTSDRTCRLFLLLERTRFRSCPLNVSRHDCPTILPSVSDKIRSCCAEHPVLPKGERYPSNFSLYLIFFSNWWSHWSHFWLYRDLTNDSSFQRFHLSIFRNETFSLQRLKDWERHAKRESFIER